MDKSPATIDIVIADDHAVFRQGLRKLLEAEPAMRIVGEAADGEQTVSIVRQLKPQILLLDLALPKLAGLEVLRELGEAGVQTRTVVLTAAIDREQVVEALLRGAHGIVLKESALDVVVKSIRCVYSGQYWVGQEGVADMVKALRNMNPYDRAAAPRKDYGLTSREMDVIALIVDGYTNKDLARKLSISEHTAKHHLSSIFDKLGVSNRLELVLFAVDHRLTGQD